MDDREQFVEDALEAADTGSAGHWPTVAGYLADEVRRLRGLADLRMNRAIDAAKDADRSAARLDAVEAYASAMEADAKYLREEYGRTGSEWTLSYANCTQIDAQTLRRVLAGAEIDGYCTCDDDLALATTCGVRAHREIARALRDDMPPAMDNGYKP